MGNTTVHKAGLMFGGGFLSPLPLGYWIHTFPLGGVALHYTNRRPGPRLSPPPSGEAGAQPRFSRQLQRSIPFFTGCGGGANAAIVSVRRVPRGIGSQGWVPAFAGTTSWGRRPVQQGQQARRTQAEMRSVHALARPAGGVEGGPLGEPAPDPDPGGPCRASPAAARNAANLSNGGVGAAASAGAQAAPHPASPQAGEEFPSG